MSQAMEPDLIALSAERGRLRLTLAAVRMGADLCVSLAGGDRAHIGAVALSQARPSLAEPGTLSASTSVLTLSGHKEDELARAMAAQLASRLDGAVCVACGIHLDAIQASELQDVSELVAELSAALIARVLARR